MKTPTWDDFGLDRKKMLSLVILSGLLAFVLVWIFASLQLGRIAVGLAAVIALLTAYALAGIPRRALEQSSLLQARDAPTLAASAAVYLQTTASRSKTFMLLKSDEPRLGQVLREFRRQTLLGRDPSDSWSILESGVRSDSVFAVMASVVKSNASRLTDQGEELDGIVKAAASKEETKFPVFLTVSFFMPIMLMLAAAIGKLTTPLPFATLVLLELIVLDLALTLSSTERRKLSA